MAHALPVVAAQMVWSTWLAPSASHSSAPRKPAPSWPADEL